MTGFSLFLLAPALARALLLNARQAENLTSVNDVDTQILSPMEAGMHPETVASLRTVTKQYLAQAASHTSRSPWQAPILQNSASNETLTSLAAAHFDIDTDAHFGIDADVRPKVGDPVAEPSVFIVVMSRRDASDRRAQIRDMWMRITGLSGNVTVRFGVCKKADDEDHNDGLAASLDAESEFHGDVMQLGCSEGYGKGHLTRKVLAAMQVYSKNYFRHDLFMKVDDDTFVRWGRFASFLHEHSHGWVYMGIPIGTAIPCRNEDYLWYEPYETFPDAEFPMAMAGGPGYTLGKDLVLDILNSGIGEANVLWNEDRAVGVWVHKLAQAGKNVEYVAVPGIDGWWAWDWQRPLNNWPQWGDYHMMIHHGLLGETIACMALADRDNDPAKNIDRCMKFEIGRTHEEFRCYQLNSDLDNTTEDQERDASDEGSDDEEEEESDESDEDTDDQVEEESDASDEDANAEAEEDSDKADSNVDDASDNSGDVRPDGEWRRQHRRHLRSDAEGDSSALDSDVADLAEETLDAGGDGGSWLSGWGIHKFWR